MCEEIAHPLEHEFMNECATFIKLIQVNKTEVFMK